MSQALLQPALQADYSRLGPLAELMSDQHVTEVMVMGTRDIYVEVDGKILLTPISFTSDDELMSVIRYIVESVGRRVDNENPLCDARLADGSRVHVAIPPVAVDGPLLNIRKFVRGPLDMADLIRLGSCSESAFGFLKACVLARTNIVVSGGTGSGKTTLLNVLSGYVPDDERIVTIEDAAELQLRQRHVARLEARPGGPDGKAVTIRDLVTSSLRMRPDRLVVGEVRGPEALDMLQAMNTGHDGSMTTLHANKPRDVLARIETLVLMAGYDLPVRAIRAQITSAINVIVHLERLRDGSRKVVQISEVTGMEEDVITMQDVFRFIRTGLDAQGRVVGRFTAAGIRPRVLDQLEDRGLEIPREIAPLFHESVPSAQ
ncbi:MAG: CpaF family protein [Chloroflexi bacterium]|nr:MAG: CpaF family protein [Chloroflexota bacterium]TME39127.1 MAG: CpaF family protein [Chloroflexota bacterium]TME49707.1 MAG: CpaF family protein [Chloroflexota bacterium]